MGVKPGKRRICAYCANSSTQIEKDHAVPRCLWEDGDRPPHMITVPCCPSCNKVYSTDEGYFRNVVVAMVDRGSHPKADRVLEGAVTRSLNKDRSLLEGMFRGSHWRRRPRPSGILDEWGRAFAVDVTRFNRIIEKTVRGLFFHKSGRPLAATHEVTVYPDNSFWNESASLSVIEVMSLGKGLGDDVFTYRCVPDSSDGDTTAWLLTFYGTVWVLAITTARQSPRQPG